VTNPTPSREPLPTESMPTNTDCYIGRRPACGCVAFWISDEAGTPADIRRQCLDVMRDGLHLSRANTVEAKAMKWGCETCKPETKAKQQEIFAEATAPAPSEPTDTERLDLLEAQAREGPWNHTRQRQMFAGISYHPTLTLREAIDFARSLPNDR
jgi:hypothetical protein